MGRFRRGWDNWWYTAWPWERQKRVDAIRQALFKNRCVGIKTGPGPVGEDRRGRLTPEGERALRDRYEWRMSIAEIAEAMDWSYGSTWRFLRRHGGEAWSR